MVTRLRPRRHGGPAALRPGLDGRARRAPISTRLGAGVAEAAGETGCAVVGGDLSAVTGPGGVGRGGRHPRGRHRTGRPAPLGGPAGRPTLRDRAARGSAAGLRRLRAGDDRPAVRAAAALVRAHRDRGPGSARGRRPDGRGPRRPSTSPTGWSPTSAISADASGVGVALDDVPVADGATHDEALGGGEDYELRGGDPSPPDALVAAFGAAGLRAPLADRPVHRSRRGECTLGRRAAPSRTGGATASEQAGPTARSVSRLTRTDAQVRTGSPLSEAVNGSSGHRMDPGGAAVARRPSAGSWSSTTRRASPTW